MLHEEEKHWVEHLSMFSSRRLNEKVMVSRGWLEDILIGSSGPVK